MIPEAARSREDLPVPCCLIAEPAEHRSRKRSTSAESQSNPFALSVVRAANEVEAPRERPFDFGLRPTLRANGFGG